MKKIFITLLVVLSFTAQAKEVTCEQYSQLAEAIMLNRQFGVPMSKQWEVAKDNDLVELMIINAYERPREINEEEQKQKIQDFRDLWFLDCVKSKSNK